MAKGYSVVQADLLLDGSQWETACKKAASSAEDLVTDTKALMAGLSVGLAATSATFGVTAAGLKSLGDEGLRLRQILSSSFSGSELESVASTIAKIGAMDKPGLDTDELVEGAKRIKVFSTQAEADLVRVANAAAGTGETFGSLKDYLAEFTTNPASQDAFKEIANIDATDLVRFGGVLDSTGKRILTMGEYADGAMKAIRGALDEKYAGALDKMATNADRLNSEFQLLGQETGRSLSEAVNSTAGFIVPLVQKLRELPTEVKAGIGASTALFSVISGGASAVLGTTVAVTDLASNIKQLGGLPAILGGFTDALAKFAGLTGSTVKTVANVAEVTTTALATVGSTALTTSTQALRLTGQLTAGAVALDSLAPAAFRSADALTTAATAAIDTERAVANVAGAAASTSSTVVSAMGPATTATITFGQAARAAALHVAALAAPYVAVIALGAAALAIGTKLAANAREQEKAEKAAAAAREAAAKARQTQLDIDGKSAKELYDAGVTVLQLEAAMEDYRKSLDAARRGSDEATEKALEDRITSLQRQLDGVGSLENTDRDNFRKSGSTALAKNYEDAAALIEYQRAQNIITEQQAIALKKKAAKEKIADEEERNKQILALDTEAANLRVATEREADEKLKAQREKDREEDFAAQMDSIKLRLTQGEITQQQAFDLEQKALDNYARSESEKRALTQRRAEQAVADEKEAADKVEKIRADHVQDRLDEIQLRRTEEKITAEQQIKAYDDVLARYKLNEDEKTKVLQLRANVAKGIRDKEAAEEKKAEDDRVKREKKNAADLAKAEEEGRDLRADAAKAGLENAKTRTGLTGKGNAQEVARLVEEQRAVAEASILAEAEKEKAATESADARVKIEENAAEKIRQLNLETADQLRDALGDQAGAVGDYIEALKKESSLTGKDNSSKLKQALQEQLNLDAESIRLQKEKALAAASSAQERADIETRYQQQIRAEQLETAQSYQDALDEMAKADEEAKRRKRGESSFSGAFDIGDLNANMQATLSQSVRNRGPSLASFAALPSVLKPRRMDDMGVLSEAAGWGNQVGAAVAGALAKAPAQQVDVNIQAVVSDDRVKVNTTTTANGFGSDIERTGRGMRGRPRQS